MLTQALSKGHLLACILNGHPFVNCTPCFVLCERTNIDVHTWFAAWPSLAFRVNYCSFILCKTYGIKCLSPSYISDIEKSRNPCFNIVPHSCRFILLIKRPYSYPFARANIPPNHHKPWCFKIIFQELTKF